MKTGEIDERATARGLSEALEKLRIEKFSPSEKFISSCRDVICKSRKTKRDGCEKRNAFIETKTKCASNLIRKVTAYLQNQSKTPSLYIKINGIQMDF